MILQHLVTWCRREYDRLSHLCQHGFHDFCFIQWCKFACESDRFTSFLSLFERVYWFVDEHLFGAMLLHNLVYCVSSTLEHSLTRCAWRRGHKGFVVVFQPSFELTSFFSECFRQRIILWLLIELDLSFAHRSEPLLLSNFKVWITRHPKHLRIWSHFCEWLSSFCDLEGSCLP